jgi:CheY-like chemotaxis protein
MKPDIPILLVEDDAVDAMTVERALKDIRVTNRVHTVGDGLAALEYLREPGARRPGIILLDLNMPRMNGIEFLKVLKSDESLRKIPVVVLTTSSDERDRVNSFDLGVAGYMIKPVDYIQFVEVVRTINLYWTISELPD